MARYALQDALEEDVTEAAVGVDGWGVAGHRRGPVLLVLQASPRPVSGSRVDRDVQRLAEPIDRRREGSHSRRTCALGVGRKLEMRDTLDFDQPSGAAVLEREHLDFEGAEVGIDWPDRHGSSPRVEHATRVSRHEVVELTRLEGIVGRLLRV